MYFSLLPYIVAHNRILNEALIKTMSINLGQKYPLIFEDEDHYFLQGEKSCR